jgi:hypothetical protein
MGCHLALLPQPLLQGGPVLDFAEAVAHFHIEHLIGDRTIGLSPSDDRLDITID